MVQYFNNRTAQCAVNTLTGTLDLFCLSKSATIRNREILGGVLTADNYIEDRVMPNDTVHLDILAITNINIPTRVVEISQKRGVTVREFWNFEEHVDPDAFLVPSVCKGRLLGKEHPMDRVIETFAAPLWIHHLTLL